MFSHSTIITSIVPRLCLIVDITVIKMHKPNTRKNVKTSFIMDDGFEKLGDNEIRFPIRANGEVFGIITRILNEKSLEILCEDETIHTTQIPGKFRQQSKFYIGDVVVVKQGSPENKIWTLNYHYSSLQAQFLQKHGIFGELEQFLDF